MSTLHHEAWDHHFSWNEKMMKIFRDEKILGLSTGFREPRPLGLQAIVLATTP